MGVFLAGGNPRPVELLQSLRERLRREVFSDRAQIELLNEPGGLHRWTEDDGKTRLDEVEKFVGEHQGMVTRPGRKAEDSDVIGIQDAGQGRRTNWRMEGDLVGARSEGLKGPEILAPVPCRNQIEIEAVSGPQQINRLDHPFQVPARYSCSAVDQPDRVRRTGAGRKLLKWPGIPHGGGCAIKFLLVEAGN